MVLSWHVRIHAASVVPCRCLGGPLRYHGRGFLLGGRRCSRNCRGDGGAQVIEVRPRCHGTGRLGRFGTTALITVGVAGGVVDGHRRLLCSKQAQCGDTDHHQSQRSRRLGPSLHSRPAQSTRCAVCPRAQHTGRLSQLRNNWRCAWVRTVESLPIVLPYVGTVSVETPEISGQRAVVHFILFLLCLYFGFISEPKEKISN
jgi:hypothetical protein